MLEAADAWRERCLVGDISILTDRNLWTAANLGDLHKRYAANPIGGARDFLDKFSQQLRGAAAPVVQVAAEAMCFLFLFPSSSIMRADTKREAIKTIWEWSGEALPSSPFLDDAHLHGVGHPGTAYMTHRYAEFEFLLRVLIAFKQLPPAERTRLLQDDKPWGFMRWLDSQEGADRRLVRNALLYFVYPDELERNLSRDHRRQIYEALKGKLPAEQRIKSRTPALADYDRAIFNIRAALTAERGTGNLDFYQDDIRNQWLSPLREKNRKNFTSWLDTFLIDRGLRLNQSGRDTSLDKLRNSNAISPETGFWSDESGLTAKPPRWLIHFDMTADPVAASVPDEHRARVIGFANTKGGDSGALAVRILPVAKVAAGEYQIIGTWEWLLLLCFPGGLKPGSAAQAFDDFDPATGVLTYMSEAIPYIFAGLLCLNMQEESFSATIGGTLKSLSYREATDALLRLINVDAVGGADA